MTYTVISNDNDLRKAVDVLSTANVLYLDTETTSLDPHQAKVLTVQIYDGASAYVVDCTTAVNTALLNSLWNNANILKVFHNASYDIKIIYKLSKGILLKNIYDTMITERLLTAGIIGTQSSLQAVARRRLGIELDKSVRNSFVSSTVVNLTQEQLEYAIKDVLILPEIRAQQLKEVADADLARVHKLEMDLTPVTSFIEYTGMPFDESHLNRLEPMFLKLIKESERVLQDIFISSSVCNQIVFDKDGYSGFNPSSNQQMLAMFNSVGINIASLNARVVMQWDFKNRRKAGDFDITFSDFSDDVDIADAMESFGSFENKYIQAYAFYTACRKIYSTYIKSLPTMQNPITKRIHCSFNQYGTATGRYSSSSPNLQNIPSDQKMKNLGISESIRHAFKVPPQNKLIIADYSTIELVIIADASADAGLIENLDDLHTFVAREVLHVKDITNDNKKQHPYKIWRDVAKMVNYSIAYNVGGDSLGKQMTIALSPLGKKVSADDGEKIIQDWKGRFPDAAKWLRNSARQMLLYGYVQDSFGRRRLWDRTLFDNKWKKLAAEREAMNFPIQALSASMVKLALVDVFSKLDLRNARIVSTIHDEIIVESANHYVEKATNILKKGMEDAAKIILPNLGNSVIVSPAVSNKYDK